MKNPCLDCAHTQTETLSGLLVGESLKLTEQDDASARGKDCAIRL